MTAPQALKPSADDAPRQASAAPSVRGVGGALVRLGCLCAVLICGPNLSASAADLYQALATDSRLSLFAKATEQAGVAATLRRPGPFTLFVPADRALRNEGAAFLLDDLLLTEPNAGRLIDLVLHHIVPGRRLTQDRLDSVDLPTLAAVPLHVDGLDNAMLVDGWAVVTDHTVADNGVLYVVDRLLWPRDWRLVRDRSQ